MHQRDITTIVADDSPAVLRAICSFVARQKNLTFIGAATDGMEVVALARNTRPDLILLDLEMPHMNGIEATSYLTQTCPTTRVVVVTAHDNQELRKLCRAHGASGFIAKEALADELPALVIKLFGSGA